MTTCKRSHNFQRCINARYKFQKKTVLVRTTHWQKYHADKRKYNRSIKFYCRNDIFVTYTLNLNVYESHTTIIKKNSKLFGICIIFIVFLSLWLCYRWIKNCYFKVWYIYQRIRLVFRWSVHHYWSSITSISLSLFNCLQDILF